ncbi:hypothetical protein GN286_04875 [Rhodobacteraceae bacterium IMCC15231]|nr:hypothetical protein [Rhodobacteraceae bacterium IMCC15231]
MQALRDDVLDDLDESGPAFAHRVRQVMFAFKDIHKRLNPSDISQITRSINTIELATALAYAKKPGPMPRQLLSLKTCLGGWPRTYRTISPI